MNLTQAFVAGVDKDPVAALVAGITLAGSVVGSIGDLGARVIDGEKHPTWWNLFKALQNAGIARPTMAQRVLLAAKGVKPSDTPPPPGAT